MIGRVSDGRDVDKNNVGCGDAMVEVAAAARTTTKLTVGFMNTVTKEENNSACRGNESYNGEEASRDM